MADKTFSQKRTLKTAYRKKYPMNLIEQSFINNKRKEQERIHHKTSEDKFRET